MKHFLFSDLVPDRSILRRRDSSRSKCLMPGNDPDERRIMRGTIRCLLLHVWLLTTLLLPLTANAEDDGSSRESPVNSTAVTSQVLRVYSAKDGDACFRSYVVSWKGQEAVVEDILHQTEYKLGDQIVFLAVNMRNPAGDNLPRLLSFLTMPLCSDSTEKKGNTQQQSGGYSLPATCSSAGDDGGSREPPANVTAVTSQVLRVYSAKDGDACFRSYVVSWKGQEVVVEDPLLRTEYKLGDQIVFLAVNMRNPADDNPPRLLSFATSYKQLKSPEKIGNAEQQGGGYSSPATRSLKTTP